MGGPHASLKRMGPPPAEWAVRTLLIVGGTFAFIIALAGAGMVLRGRPGPGFAEGRPGTWASVALLLWGAALAARIWWRNDSGVSRPFWAVAAAGLAAVAADDLFQFHERAAEALHRVVQWDAGVLSTQTLDGLLVALYGIAALAVAWPQRRALLRLPWFAVSALAAGFFFALMVTLDVVDVGGRAPEEGSKIMGAACIVAALYGVIFDRGAARAPMHAPSPRSSSRATAPT